MVVTKEKYHGFFTSIVYSSYTSYSSHGVETSASQHESQVITKTYENQLILMLIYFK